MAGAPSDASVRVLLAHQPRSAMAAAAAVTERINIGCRVFCVDYHLPGPLATRVTTDARWRWGLVAAGGGGGATATVVVGDVATPLAITKAAALARRLARATGAAVENLEAFGVARAAHRAGVPFGAVLGISNRVGPRAHEEWVRHQDRATRAASEVAGALLLSVPAR